MSGRTLAVVIGLLTVLASVAPAQTGDGHIVMSLNTTLPKTRQFYGAILVYDPARDLFTTLTQTSPSWDSSGGFAALVMGSDNRGLVALGTAAGGAGTQTYRKITARGAITTVAQGTSSPVLSGVGGDLILDCDGGWLAVGPRSHGIFRLDDATHRLTTLFDRSPTNIALEHFCGIAPRLEGDDTFWVLNWHLQRNSPPLLTATRKGVITTIAVQGSWLDLSGRIRSEPQTGAVWTSRRVAAATTGGVLLVRWDPSGKVTTLQLGSGLMMRDFRVAQDGTLWAIESRSNAISFPPDVLHHIATDGSVILVKNIAGTGSNKVSIGAAVALEIYGRRRLVVTGDGKPGSKAVITIVSLKPSDAGLAYQLAASLARRPGVRPRTGEWLHLAHDSVFALSVSGATPQVFARFNGFLSSTGAATAAINVPSSLPRGLDIPIFVAGVIYDRGGVRTVTNTHWLILR